MKIFYISPMRHCLLLALICWLYQTPTAQAQITYTANDAVLNYNKVFRFGTNLGYYPNWTTDQLGGLAAGDPALGLKGVGTTTARPALSEDILETYGYDALLPTFEGFYQKGIRDMNVILGNPSYPHRDPTNYCPGVQSDLFANLYEPIWDGGANGTPVNENNYYAAYVWKVVTKYKKYVRIWEVLNEPDFDFTGQQWQGDYLPNFGWWVNNPGPCEYQLHSPIFRYIRMLHITWEVVKTADPTAFVEIGALGYPHFLDAVMRNTENPVDGSVTAQYPLKGGAYFDVLGYHTYPHIDGSLWTYNPGTGGVTGYHRNSDGGIDSGVIKKQIWFQRVLNKYGYNGTTYPKKQWTITEFNLPRKAFESRYVGGEELQRNSLVKAAVTCYQYDIMQLQVYSLGDEKLASEANYEFHLMGFYKKLTAATPPATVEVNSMGIAYKTASDILSGSVYDAAKTAAMNLPANLGGGAFRLPNNNYVYVLWAKTLTDYSEDAFATYSFPASFGFSNLQKREWFYSQNNASSTISANNIILTGAPIFLATAFAVPIELRDFSGTRVEHVSQLKWQTATELNTANFDIQRSDDGQDFKNIGQVKAMGTTTTPQYYSYSDATNLNGTAYYRLKSNDLDGKVTYSKVIALTDKSIEKPRIFPNPFGKKLVIQLNNEAGVLGDFDLTLTDVSGKIVLHQVAKNGVEWATDNLPAGIYFLKIAGNGTSDIQKLVKY